MALDKFTIFEQDGVGMVLTKMLFCNHAETTMDL